MTKRISDGWARDGCPGPRCPGSMARNHRLACRYERTCQATNYPRGGILHHNGRIARLVSTHHRRSAILRKPSLSTTARRIFNRAVAEKGGSSWSKYCTFRKEAQLRDASSAQMPFG